MVVFQKYHLLLYEADSAVYHYVKSKIVFIFPKVSVCAIIPM